MITESAYTKFYPQGRFRDRLIDRDGRVLLATDWQHNLIVEGLRRLVAALVMGDPQGVALAHWAVGTGNDTWDGGSVPPPASIESRTQLFNETGRIAVPPTQIAFVNPPLDNEIEISGEFTIADISGGEPNRRLREFALFAGGSMTTNSGIMINHRIHPRIDMQSGFTLQRTLRLTF